MESITKTKKFMVTLALIILIPLFVLSIIGQQKIHIKRELTINKSIDNVWLVMGKQFGEVHLWSSNFKDSKPSGEKLYDGINYSQRITTTERGETIQVLDSFDSANYKLMYHISKGLPSIAKSAVGIWSLKSMQNQQTIVVLEFEMESKNILGYLLAPMIKLKLGKSAEEIAEELKHYMENGTPHPRNTMSISK